MQTTSDSVFANLKENYHNMRCFDCQAQESDWCSVNHGVFLCLKCAGKHRGLGVHISFVRSITMDRWQAKHLKMMEMGGNDLLQRFFDNYQLEDYTIEDKYRTKAAYYYREMLKSLAEESDFDALKPCLDEGKTIVEEEKRNFYVKSIEKDDSDTQRIKEMVDDAIEYTKDFGRNIKKKASEVSISDVENKAKAAFCILESKVDSWDFKGKLEMVVNKTEGVYNEIAKKAKTTFDKIVNNRDFEDTELIEAEDELMLDPQGKNRINKKNLI